MTPGRARFLEGFSEGSFKEMLLRRVPRRRLLRVSVGTEVLRRVPRRGGVIEGAWKVLRRKKHALSQSTTRTITTEDPRIENNSRLLCFLLS